MNRSLRAVAVCFTTFAVVTPVRVVEAGPFRAFFQAVRSAVVHPTEKPRSHRHSHKHNETPPNDASESQSSDSPVSAPPGRRNVRAAKAASGADEQKPELPYGTPVPGKSGLVTSPFAPDRGYVDVSGFAPGTQVHDPYTGKIFLTP